MCVRPRDECGWLCRKWQDFLSFSFFFFSNFNWTNAVSLQDYAHNSTPTWGHMAPSYGKGITCDVMLRQGKGREEKRRRYLAFEKRKRKRKGKGKEEKKRKRRKKGDEDSDEVRRRRKKKKKGEREKKDDSKIKRILIFFFFSSFSFSACCKGQFTSTVLTIRDT